ncbi:thioredoxin-like protein [Leucosporidium creatinivorum]|uniref:Thioredoxin-like protein n=1 Tax=Leucosporidium creatinivorum TaxID=106004 RepID=A0A1Y2G2W3_9BASI|nr:thioredoxin-like protein [Leucosporidium creatinivorum]
MLLNSLSTTARLSTKSLSSPTARLLAYSTTSRLSQALDNKPFANKMTNVPELTLYYSTTCPWAQRGNLALYEVDAKVNRIEIDLKNKPSWYTTKVNPAGKVPVLQVGSDEAGTKIPESHVILELVSDLYPGKLLPQDALKRAEARYFIERFNQIITTPFFTNLIQGQDNTEALLNGVTEIQGLLAKYDGPFALGEKLSAADLGVAPFVGRFFAMGQADALTGSIYEKISTDPTYAPFVAYHKTLTGLKYWESTFPEKQIVEDTKAFVAKMRASKA